MKPETENAERTGRDDMRPGLREILPAHMSHLPIDRRGYPVPWFVRWINGEPDFRVADPEKLQAAIVYRRCWICGGKLGTFLTFVGGPLCLINRTSSEPASHRACAQFAARACPFLTIPAAQYRDRNRPASWIPAPGEMQLYNPTACVLWTSRGFVLSPVDGGVLLDFLDAESVEFWSRGRLATREEFLAALAISVATIRASAAEHGDARTRDRVEQRIVAAYKIVNEVLP